ncbi:SMAD/FHA domain-containing protein, partial [Patellaria atrata CBS 101060]
RSREPPRRRTSRSSSVDYHRRRERRSRSRDDYRRRDRRSRSPDEGRRRHYRSRSPRGNWGNHRRSRSPDGRRRGDRRSRSPDYYHRRPERRIRSRSRSKKREQEVTPRTRNPLPSQLDSYRTQDPSARPQKPHKRNPPTDPSAPSPLPEKQTPNYAPTGLLALETNTVAGTSVVLKYHEPPDARKPPSSSPWRLYIFKGSSVLSTLELHTSSVWLVGREAVVADILAENPSVSKQHAVLQFRYTTKRKGEFGEKVGKVRPYVIDLESANGTWLNGDRVEARRYVEVRDKDVLRFGTSEREYVIMLP